MLREMRIEDCFHSFFTDCRFARRQLQKSPIFTTVAVLTLAQPVVIVRGPDQKIREHDGDTEYEEWIFGAPPQDVEFVRFVGDEVVQDKIMRVGGEKVVRTEREIEMKQTTVPMVARNSPAAQSLPERLKR